MPLIFKRSGGVYTLTNMTVRLGRPWSTFPVWMKPASQAGMEHVPIVRSRMCVPRKVLGAQTRRTHSSCINILPRWSRCYSEAPTIEIQRVMTLHTGLSAITSRSRKLTSNVSTMVWYFCRNHGNGWSPETATTCWQALWSCQSGTAALGMRTSHRMTTTKRLCCEIWRLNSPNRYYVTRGAPLTALGEIGIPFDIKMCKKSIRFRRSSQPPQLLWITQPWCHTVSDLQFLSIPSNVPVQLAQSLSMLHR